MATIKKSVHPSRLPGLPGALLALGLSLCASLPAFGAATDIASGPLAQPATSVKPNMLMILDDSGSMVRMFTPDYASSNGNAGTVRNCMDSRDITDPPSANPQDCYAGDPPSMAPEFNTQYYNPEIRYFPAVNFDGTSKGEMNASATTNWTAVPTDNVSTSADNTARRRLHTGNLTSTTANGTDWESGQSQGTVSTFNLTAEYPDRVWCNSTGATATDTTNCKTNNSYTYPGATFGYGRDGTGNRKYKLGAPYYYRITPTEFCSDIALTNCIAATVATVSGGVTYDKPAPVRFCDSTAHTNCQRKRTSTFRFPKFLGTVNPSSPASPGTKARGVILLQQGDTGIPTINQITITLPDTTFVNLLGAAFSTVATNTDTNRQAAAVTIRDRINLNFGAHGYIASIGNNNNTAHTTEILIDAPVVGNTFNGSNISVNAPIIGISTPASLSFDIGGANSNSDRVNTLGIGPPGGPAQDLIGGTTIRCDSIRWSANDS